MAKPKSVTIQLTAKQRTQLRSLTGVDHNEIKFEATPSGAPKLATRMAGRSVGKAFTPHRLKVADIELPFPK